METNTDHAYSLLLIATFVAVLAAFRFLLWRGLAWFYFAWEHGPVFVREGARISRADRAAAWLAERFPRPTTFLSNRVDPQVFTGLPLTLIVCAALYLVFLFSGLVEEVLETDEIEVIDGRIVAWVALLRTSTLTAFFRWITELGSMPTLTAVAIVASAFLLAHGPQRYVAPLWLTVIGSQVTTYSGKFLLARPRPDFVLDVTAYTPSFPSGHTTGAMAVYGMIAYTALRDVSSRRARFDIAFGTAVLIGLVSLSRVVLGVHFPSDIAAGLLVGLFWLLAGVALAEIRRATPE